MTKLSTFGCPNPGHAGILHPQFPDRFAVYFRAEFGDNTNSTELVKLMHALTCQLTTVQLPELALGGYASKRIPGDFGPRRHTGNVKFVFQEDVTGLVSEALERLTDGSIPWLGATICKLDGDSGVLEAFDLRNVRFLSVQHSTLTYYSRGSSINGTIQDQKVDDHGNPLAASNVTLRYNDGLDACAHQTVTASADLILAARFPGGKPLNDLLGDL